MASGNIVGHIIQVLPPGASFATPDTRAGGSTPAESIMVWDFDASTDEYLDFLCELRGYGGGGITAALRWMASSATSGVTRWGGAFRRINDDAEDVDGSQTYDFNEVDCTAASASGEFAYDTITFTDGADMDSVANGESFIFRLYRNADHANDTMTGDAELATLLLLET